MRLTGVLNEEIFRPRMAAIRERLHGIAILADDISPVFPYLNAELGGWDYDRKNQVLLLKLSAGQWITLHAREIALRGGPGIWRRRRPCWSGSRIRLTIVLVGAILQYPRNHR